MTTTTLTAETAAGDLLTELRDLLNRHTGAATLDEVRDFADEITATLRRTRGRIARIARQVKPESPSPKPAAADSTPAEPAAAVPAPRQEPPSRSERVPAPQPERTTAGPKIAAADPDPRPSLAAPFRISRARALLAVVVVTASALFGRARTAVTKRLCAATSAARRIRAGAVWAERRNEKEVCIVCGPDCCSPIVGVHTSCPGPLAGRTVVGVR